MTMEMMLMMFHMMWQSADDADDDEKENVEIAKRTEDILKKLVFL